ALQRGQYCCIVERARTIVDVNDRCEHKHGTGHRVQEELDRRVNPPVITPDADEKVHWHQRDFPKYVEQEQVESTEHADQAELEEQQECEKLLDAFVDVLPRNQDANRSK